MSCLTIRMALYGAAYLFVDGLIHGYLHIARVWSVARTQNCNSHGRHSACHQNLTTVGTWSYILSLQSKHTSLDHRPNGQFFPHELDILCNFHSNTWHMPLPLIWMHHVCSIMALQFTAMRFTTSFWLCLTSLRKSLAENLSMTRTRSNLTMSCS